MMSVYLYVCVMCHVSCVVCRVLCVVCCSFVRSLSSLVSRCAILNEGRCSVRRKEVLFSRRSLDGARQSPDRVIHDSRTHNARTHDARTHARTQLHTCTCMMIFAWLQGHVTAHTTHNTTHVHTVYSTSPPASRVNTQHES